MSRNGKEEEEEEEEESQLSPPQGRTSNRTTEYRARNIRTEETRQN